MDAQLLELDLADWHAAASDPQWIAALERGQVLYFPRLAFTLLAEEGALLTPAVLSPKARNISLDAQGQLKGAAGDADAQRALRAMLVRFQTQAQQLIHGLLPDYKPALRLAPTSYRPMQVQSRQQSWRADDRRLHIDAFPSRPNHGERILRVFTNVNPHGAPRKWRVGEPFEAVAQRYLPRTKRYARWQAVWLERLRITKSLRSEYDHLMLQLHDQMKADAVYQAQGAQQSVDFAAGSVWICFSDQTPHAVMEGQYMLEQTLHLQPARQYNPASSPLEILRRLTGRPLL